MERWVRTPPSAPFGIVAIQIESELIGAHDLSADPFEISRCVPIVKTGRPGAGGVTQHALTEGSCCGIGRDQREPVLAKGFFGRAYRSGSVAIEGNIEVGTNTHQLLPLSETKCRDQAKR